MDAYRAGVHRVPVGAGVHTARQLANNLINVTLDSLFIKTFQKTWVHASNLLFFIHHQEQYFLSNSEFKSDKPCILLLHSHPLQQL